jgi:ketosteroid isomerase-like protein
MQRALLLAVVLLPFLSTLGGCSSREERLPDDVTSALETAYTRGDVAGCVAIYTDDAEILGPDAPAIRGKQAIEAFFKDQVARDISFDTDSTMSIVHGDLAVEQGTYRVRNVRVGENVEYGEYLNVWRRSGGHWRVHRSMYNVMMSRHVGVSVTPDEEDSVPPPPSQPH